MRDLVIMPAMAQRRQSLNMGEFAEEAIIVEEVAAPKKVNHFIEANTPMFNDSLRCAIAGIITKSLIMKLN